MVKVINMPGKKFKSIGIREKLYNRIEEEKKEGESTSDYIERVIDIAKKEEEIKNEVKSNNETRYGRVGLTAEDVKNAVKEVLGERKEQGNVITTDINAGITIEDLKRELIKVEVETVDKIKAKIEELKGF